MSVRARRRLDRELVLSRTSTGLSPPARVRVWREVVTRSHRASTGGQLPDALEAVARSLRAGASLPMAIDEASRAVSPPLDAELRSIATAAGHGRSVASAVDEWAAHTTSDGAQLAAAALSLAAEIGGSAARSLDGVADTLRDRAAARREVHALSAQARASALVIGLAPVAFAAIVVLTDPATAAFFVTTGVGLVCLAVGVALDVLGGWWMRAIVRAAGADGEPVAARQADVVDLFVLAIGAGLNLHLAIEAVAPRAPPVWADGLRDIARKAARGQPVGDALDALPGELGEPARPLARALAGAERYGTPLLPALERLAADARLDRRHRAAEAARRVPVKLLFPLVLCVLPAFGLLTVAPLLAGAFDALRL